MNPQLVQTLAAMNVTLTGLTTTLTALEKSNRQSVRSGGGSSTTGITKLDQLINRSANRMTSDLFRIFGPLVAFGTLLNAATSGFSLFTGAIKVAATAAGALLLPLFTVFSAAILTFVDMLMQPEMFGAMEEYFHLIISSALSMADSLKVTANDVRSFGNELRKWLEWLGLREPTTITDENSPELTAERKRVKGLQDQENKGLVDWMKGQGLTGYKTAADGTTEVKQNDKWVAATDEQAKMIDTHNKRMEKLNIVQQNAVNDWSEEMSKRALGNSPNANWSKAPKNIEELDKLIAKEAGAKFDVDALNAYLKGEKTGRSGEMAGKDIVPSDFVGPLTEQQERERSNLAGKKNASEPGAMFRKSLTEVMQQMRFENAPRPQSFSLTAFSKQAQLAALNQSPFEVKMQDMTQKIIGLMEKVVANQGRDRGPMPPASE